MNTMLTNLKLMLGISGTDRDDMLNYILASTSQRLINLLGLLPIDGADPTVPAALSHVVVDVACARFNRIASEGMRSDSVEGESLSFYDHDFDPYRDEMTAWLAMQDDALTGGKGKVQFI